MAPPGLLPAACEKLDAGPQGALARWLSSRAGRGGARVWIHDGEAATCKLGEELRTVRRQARKPIVGSDEPERAGAEHRAVIVALGGGYQSTGRGSYGALAADVSVRLFRPLRLAVTVRPALSQPVVDPTTGDSLGRMSLLTFAIGPRLRFTRPIVQVIGLGFQLAWSPHATVGSALIAGPVVTFGFDLPLGASPLFLRPLLEVGTLGRFFQFRGMLQLGAALGPAPK
jgi:hypothetical protein